MVSASCGDANVIKAFNTIFAANQANPTIDIDGVGPLSAARHLEGMAWLNIGLNAANGWGWTSAWRLDR